MADGIKVIAKFSSFPFGFCPTAAVVDTYGPFFAAFIQ